MSKKRQRPDAGDESVLVRSYAVTHPRGMGLPERVFAAWDQLLFASRGVMAVVTAQGTWVIPPQRALWLPAGISHAVRMSGRVTLRAANRILTHGSATAVQDVAREVGASVRTLERLFARDTTLTFGRWRRRARMAEALRLLGEGVDVTRHGECRGLPDTERVRRGLSPRIGYDSEPLFRRRETNYWLISTMWSTASLTRSSG